MKLFTVAFLVFCVNVFGQNASTGPVYLNYNLPVQERVRDLVSRMTLQEKISQMANSAEAIPGLRVPAYNWWNECLHGVARAGIATVFPQGIGLAATWNVNLMHKVADVISTEARAKYNYFISKGDRGIFKGLTFWSPNINIFRDPRWGRGQETYGEDPYLTSRMGVAYVKGLQGSDPKYFKVIATPKHFAVHSGPEPDRHMFDAVISSRDLFGTYLPAFEACIKEGGAFSVMCAYNSLWGKACCGSPALLHTILRKDWGFKGYVVSDCGAVADIYLHHKIVGTAPEAAAAAVESGTDLNCGMTYSENLLDAVKKGLLPEKDIDTAVTRLFTARFKLGMFDPDSMVEYSRIPFSENDSPAHRELALKAAEESVVLLKNQNGLLPLKKDIKRIAVIGPTADSYLMLLGNYNGTPSKYVTPLQGIKNAVSENTKVEFEQGCNLVREGPVRNYLNSEMLNTGGTPGLKAEFFKNDSLSGQPFYSRIDPIAGSNWIYSARIPSFNGSYEIASVRWEGKIKPAADGDYNFLIHSNGGYRLIIGDQTVLDKMSNDSLDTGSNHLHMNKNKEYRFTLEYSVRNKRPLLTVELELMHKDYFKSAVDLAANSDIVIFVGGITSQLEGEEMPVDLPGFKGGDRTNLKLPAVQDKLLKAVRSTGTPVVLVLTSGSALAVDWENANIPAILQLWYPGEEGGTALAEVLFGDYNPAGRLPVTFYKSVDQLPPFSDYNMKGHTYRYFTGVPLYTFGYGLSYTKFKYGDLRIPDEVRAGDSVEVSAVVQNTGKAAGDEVVQLYVKNETAKGNVPIRSLEGFKRITLRAGEKQTVKFILRPKQLSVIEQAEKPDRVRFVVEPGNFKISVGGSQPDIKVPTTGTISKEIKITGRPFTVEED